MSVSTLIFVNKNHLQHIHVHMVSGVFAQESFLSDELNIFDVYIKGIPDIPMDEPSGEGQETGGQETGGGTGGSGDGDGKFHLSQIV